MRIFKLIIISLVIYLLIGIIWVLFIGWKSDRLNLILGSNGGLAIIDVLTWPVSLSTYSTKSKMLNKNQYAPGVLIVDFKPGISREQCETILESNKLQYRIFSTTEDFVAKNGRLYIVNVPVGQEEKFKQNLLKIPEIRYIDFDYIATLQ